MTGLRIRIARFAGLAWASPCSLVGLSFAVVVLLCGGRARRRGGTLEVSMRRTMARGRLLRSMPFRAITLGHVIVATTPQELDRLRAHERVHVRQYERWGVAFFFAYAASSLWQLLRGRRAYWDNHFEIEARARSAGPASRGEHPSLT